jgi:hypothetical protein
MGKEVRIRKKKQWVGAEMDESMMEKVLKCHEERLELKEEETQQGLEEEEYPCNYWKDRELVKCLSEMMEKVNWVVLAVEAKGDVFNGEVKTRVDELAEDIYYTASYLLEPLEMDDVEEDEIRHVGRNLRRWRQKNGFRVEEKGFKMKYKRNE